MTTEIPTTQAFDKILNRVRGLLNKADSTDSPEESNALRLKAEQLMVTHAIEQAQLDASRPADQRLKPEVTRFTVFSAGHRFARHLATLAYHVAEHCRCEIMFHDYYSSWGDTTVTVVGYPSDIRYFELLYTTLYAHLSGDITPKPDPSKSFDENVYILHEAGIKWEGIARLLNIAYGDPATHGAEDPRKDWRKAVRPGKSQPWILVPWPDGHRLINAYRRHCKILGEDPHAIMSPDLYRESFAKGFTSRIYGRLWRLRQETKGMVGSSLALRQESVKEMFDELFPPYEPPAEEVDTPKAKKARKTRVRQERIDHDAQAAGRESANRANLHNNAGVQNTTKPLT